MSQQQTQHEMRSDLNELCRVRREKLTQLQQDGCDPFAVTTYDVTAYANDINLQFDQYEGQTVSVAGRIMSKRGMGKAGFLDLADASGRIQSYVRKDQIGEQAYEAFKKYDIGDIIGITGEVFRTQKGQISVKAEQLTLLSKSLRPLPEKWHGLKDQDTRYRQRYVDLIVNPYVKNTFVMRSSILREIRCFLDSRGYLEVDTPVLHTLEIGAAARPFITHHNTLDIDMYLRIETELYLKRLIVGGFDRVYEVGRIFRNEGMSVKHNPEFTTIELYQAYTDYHGMMDLVEAMHQHLIQKLQNGNPIITYQGVAIDFSRWERLSMADAVKKYADVDYHTWVDDAAAVACAKQHEVEIEDNATKGSVLIAFFEQFVEDQLIQPTFIFDYPIENSPLAKRIPENPAFTQRFEYFIYAREMGNAFSELNDPIDQRQRLIRQVEAKRALGENAELDEDFITALEYGLPPTGGLGFGLDRLVMLLTDSPSIRDVLLFPTMKPIKE